MTATRNDPFFLRMVFMSTALACTAISGAMASEYHGTVKTGGLPVPGVTVTAIQSDKRVATTTDERGQFSFADLADGIWTLEAEMLGFSKLTREVGVAQDAPAPELLLKILSEPALLATLEPSQPVPTHAPPVANPALVTPRTPPANARPASQQQGGFQRVNVNQSATASAIGNEGAIKTEEIADLNQSAANSFIVQGSLSSASGLPQMNDWGPGGRGMGPDGMGGPGMGGPGGDGAGGGPTGMAIGGRGGPGGGGPGGGGGRGGMMGGGPGGGGPGGGGPGGPPMGGGPEMGGRGGGRGGPDWQGRPNAMAFGNGRRDPRLTYNGNASFSLDNSVWDARSFSVTGANVNKPSYANGRAAVMFGGPLRIPKLVSASKRILFTFDYQAQRNRTGTISDPVNMPTALERIGDFSQSTVQGAAVTIYDPTTGSPFPGNKIPANRISATSTALLQYFPNPNLASAAQNYQTSWSGRNNSQNINSRVSNIKIGSQNTINASVGYQGSSSVSPNLFQFIDTGAGRGINASLAWSRAMTTRVINNLRYTFSRSRQLSSPFFANRENVAGELGISGTSQDAANWGPPNLSFTNYGGLSDGNYSLNRNQTSAIGESITWVHGVHNFSFGADYRRQQTNQLADNNGRGTYTFNGSVTSYLVNSVAQANTGYDLADFLLGFPSTSSIRYGNPDKYFRSSGYDFFVNDDWRITSKFSLNFGLRWDYATPFTELYNRLVNLDIAPGYTAVTAVPAGSGDLPTSLIYPDRNNFSPRLGFAWRPLNKGSLVVRGGYGAYYNTSVYNVIAGNLAQQPPFAQALSVSTSAANPLTIGNGFLLGSNQSLSSTYAIDPNYRVGYAQTWTLSVQHDLPLGMFATAGYLGTKGTRLDQQFIPNSVAPGATVSTLPHSFIYETSNGDSIYHAAQFQLNRRFRSGIMANAGYQFSKSIDNAGTGGRGQGNTPVAQNWLDLAAERGLSSFDARHNLNLQFQYSTGMGKSGGTLVNGWKGALMKDWTFSGNVSVRSGNPFTATVGGNRSQVSGTAVSNTLRADTTGLPVEASGLLFNTAAFSAPLSGLWGNAGRNTIPGPTTFSLNGSMGRIFRIGERRSADLQFQAQNLLNHVTITNWGTVLGTTNYGLATSAASMRKLTINLRFRF
jgi:trimeric autotransporter adhesin